MQATARAALGDAALGVGVAAAVAAAVTVDPVGAGRPLAAYGFALGFGAIVLLRRSAPVLTLLATAGWLVVYYAAGLPPIGLAVPVAAALYSAAVAGRLTAAVAVVVALLGVSIAVRLLEGDDPGYVLGVELAPSAGLMIAVTALGAAVRARRLLRVEMRARAEQAAREREREAARRVEAERLRIARDLHDALGHGVSVITLQTAVAREALQARETDAAAAALAVIGEASAGAMAELRATLGSLRGDDPQGREPAGGLDRVDRVAALVRSSGLPVTVRVEGTARPLPAVVDATAHRIVQEALTNALRHAHASRAEVVLRYGAEALEVTVSDDGRGGTGDPGGGEGLRGMRERAALLGGAVRAGPGAGGGFTVEAVLPLVPERVRA